MTNPTSSKSTLTIFLSLLLFIVKFTQGQGQPPLVGPVIAGNVPQQDRILLYDLGARDPAMRLRELTFGTDLHRVWDFSPDGCRILFTLSDGTLPAKLYSARVDGQDMRAMVRFDELPSEQWGIWEPDWSPDGSRIAFTMFRSEIKRDGSVERKYHIAWVTPETDVPEFYSVTGGEFSPQWSPDSQWLAYVSYDERVAGVDIFSTAEPTQEPPPGQPTVGPTLLEEADIWVVSADAATKFQLTNFPTGSVHDPRWSPDGELISFVYSPSPNNDTIWMIANARNAIPTQLNFEWVLVLDNTWLPDSTAILAAVRNFRQTPQNRLWTIPLVGNADTDATLYPDDTTGSQLVSADYPRFSPDGQWLALRSAYQLAVLNVPSRTWDILDAATLANSPPIWSPAAFAGETVCDD
jgi:Tol biopolymer transport system component